MNVSRYTLKGLRRHTASIRKEASKAFKDQYSFLADAIRAFDAFLSDLESEPVSLIRNVKMMLSCKFFNHVYSGILLTESGLFADAIACERNALENLAFFRLVCLDASAATEYNSEKIPRPIEVRKRLEKLGAKDDLDHIRDLYSWTSDILHVSRASERFHASGNLAIEGNLFFGGTFSGRDQGELLRFFAVLLYWFHQPFNTGLLSPTSS